MMKFRDILLGATCGAAVAMTPAAIAQEQNVEQAEETKTLNTIVVTGIRKSLQDGVEAKRSADSILDGISAEDVGKFPDTNVAESLQRITGVAITRSRGGEGQFVTVRGLGEEFNGVTFNGRTLATENLGREFSFDVIASELISRAEVYKASQARLADGGIGGLVNIASARPLDSSGFNFSGSIAGEHDNLTEEIGTRASGILSNTFANDTMGIIGSFSYQKRDVRSDTYESIDYQDLQLVSKDINGDGTIGGLRIFDATRDTADEIVARGRQSTYSVGTSLEERERIGGTLAFQYQPNENIDIVADALYTKYKSPGESNFTTIYFGSPRAETLSTDGNVITGYTADFTSDLVARAFESDTDTLALGLNGKFNVNERLRLTGDVSYSKAEGVRDNVGSGAGGGNFLVLGIQGGEATYAEAGELDHLSVQVPNFAGTNLVDISEADPRLLRAHFNRISTFNVEDTIFAVKGAGEFDVNDFATLHFGFDYTDREKSNNLFANSDATTNGQCEFCSYTENFQSLNPVAFEGFASPLSDQILGGNANIPQGFLAFSAADLRGILGQVNIGDYNAGNAALPSAGLSILATQLDRATSNTVEESIFGGFVQLNLESEIADIPYTANFGVRVAQTSLTSSGFRATPQSVIIAADGLNQSFILSDSTPTSIRGDYTNFLPSANISFELTDELFLRGAFSKTLSRPTMTDLSTKFSVGSTNLGVEQIDTGNPGLEAPESTNFDLSLEWYGESGSAASLAFFNKDIDGFVANQLSTETLILNEVNPANVPDGTTPGQRTVFVSRPENAETASITGVEASYQYISPLGLGFLANVTFVESEAKFEGQDEALGLENVSPLSYNLSGFYEDDRFSARLSYNFREGYLETTAGLQNHPESVDDYGQLDFSSSFTINDHATLFVDAINLTEESSYTYSQFTNLIRNYEENGRRIVFGVRASF